MANTHFVIIHGLDWKPAESVLHRRFVKHLSEGVGRDFPGDRLHLAYWADLMGYESAEVHRDEYVDGRNHFEAYSWWEQIKFFGRGVARGHIVQLVEQRLEECLADPKLHTDGVMNILSGLPDRLVNAPARRIYECFLPDMHRYFFGGKKESVRDRLRQQLDKVPDQSDICLMAHSMGSIIAADLIISGTRHINTLVTMGSPLGIRAVQEQINASQAKETLSTKIGQWFNLYDRLDIVALDSDLADDYAPMNILDIRIRNEFVNSEDDRNHHKSYGYLRSPELGEIVGELL